MADLDIKTLPQEVQDYLAKQQSEHDKKVNEISQANRKDAADKLRQDQTFLASVEKSVRDRIEADAKKTAEERAHELIAEAEGKLKIVRQTENKLAAREECNKAGMSKEEYEGFLEILVDEDSEKSSTKVQKFIDTFVKGVGSRVEIEKAKLKGLEQKPNTGNGESQKTLKDYSTVDGMKKLNAMKESNPIEYARLLNTI